MLEGWTTLGFMAAHAQKARLGLMVGGVHYRNPGLWVKAATTLDVLSGGRAWLGLGAGWNEAESVGLGFPFPGTKTRFEMLEDNLQIAHHLFEGEQGSEARFEGRQFTAERLLNVPQSISRPRVPIMIGGGGEQKTLRLVARYADASNLFGDPDQLRHKYRVLAEHCEAVGRPFEEIERHPAVGEPVRAQRLAARHRVRRSAGRPVWSAWRRRSAASHRQHRRRPQPRCNRVVGYRGHSPTRRVAEPTVTMTTDLDRHSVIDLTTVGRVTGRLTPSRSGSFDTGRPSTCFPAEGPVPTGYAT